MVNEKSKFTLVDDPSLRETYADTMISTGFFNGVCVLTMGATRYIPKRTNEAPKDGTAPTVYTTARLAMTPNAAVEVVNVLTNMLNTLSQAERAAQAAQEQPKH